MSHIMCNFIMKGIIIMKKLKRVMATAIAIAAVFTSSMTPVQVSAATPTPKAVAATSTSSSKIKKNVKFTFKKTQKGVLAFVKNKNKFDVEVHADVTFKNKKGKTLNKATDRTYCLGKGRTCVFSFECFNPKTYKYESFKSYKVTYTVEKALRKASYSHKITSKFKKKTDSSITYRFTNKSNKKLSFIHATLVFYDKKGKVIDSCEHFISCTKKGSHVDETFYAPYNSKTYDYIKYSKVKLFIDYAYLYL